MAALADADTATTTKDAKEDEKNTPHFAPFPSDRSVAQSAVIGGRHIAYRATVGSIEVRDDKGKAIGEVVYTAYTLPKAGPQRPVTFAFNGGPGASSVYLNLGAIGPKRVRFGDKGDSPSDPPILEDNPSSWLDMTDLVFIDPVGTGFSRSLESADKTKKDFYANEPDIKYLSRVVYDWLVRNGRLRSLKYVIGESYGGYRAPRIAHELVSALGVGVSGIVMVSPYLDPAAVGDGTALSPLPWMINLPSMTAGHLEREGRLSAAAMQDVMAYTRGQFATDLLAGSSDPEAQARLVAKVSGYTGLDPALVRKLGGRVDVDTYLREVHRDDQQLGSVYDSNIVAYDPFPWSAQNQANDPMLDMIIAPTTSAMVDFITRVVGWNVDARYNALSYAVNEAWDRGKPQDRPVSDLRKAIAIDPKMGVLIAHGWDDLSCPFFGSRLIVDQLPRFGVAERVHLGVYPGGHMFYTRTGSAEAFKHDAAALYARRG
ncbi:MAG: peptidase S10 [Sphingomonadaceae bacterium]|nr:peptidase S10 [Sphingomonadaceae bacterium]